MIGVALMTQPNMEKPADEKVVLSRQEVLSAATLAYGEGQTPDFSHQHLDADVEFCKQLFDRFAAEKIASDEYGRAIEYGAHRLAEKGEVFRQPGEGENDS